jgi:hypothetical protein
VLESFPEIGVIEIDGEVRSESDDCSSAAAISAFAADLASVIEQLEMECARDRLGRETVARIRELRERAEQIFGDFS